METNVVNEVNEYGAEIVKTERGGLPFKRTRVYIVQTGRETKKFKMAPATFYNHLIS